MKRVALLTSGLVLVASLAAAQELSKAAKIERLLALTNADATVNLMFDQMKAQMKTMTASQMPAGTTPEQRAKAEDVQTQVLDLVKSRMSWEKMRPEYVKLYSETFSDEEIDGMLAFYQSPAGRAMLEKMPAMMPKIMALAQAQMGDLTSEILRIAREAQEK
jgi:hypothetical protein